LFESDEKIPYNIKVCSLKFFIATWILAASSAYGHAYTSPNKSQYQRLVLEASAEYLIDPRLIFAIIKNESSWQPWATSTKGAVGLMQLMPATSKQWGVKDPFDPRDNIFGGARYLRHLINLFDKNIPLAVAAYHAGEAKVIQEGEIPHIKETQQYVGAVLYDYGKLTGFRQ
jgi:soluble lytic murein transglycosylase-like protein